MKTLLDLAPLAVFFIAWTLGGLYAATAALVAACALQCLALKIIYGKTDRMALAVFAVTFVLGALTLALQNDAFILVKPTIVYLAFAAALLVADFAFGKNAIQLMMEKFFTAVPAPVWRKASCAWAGFFLCAAAVNLWAAFSLSEAAWVKIKTFGFPAATFLFAAAQVAAVGAKDAKPAAVHSTTNSIGNSTMNSSGNSTMNSAAPAGENISLKRRIAGRLAALNPLELEVRDDSARHRGHAEAGSGAHFQVRVVSEQFAGLSRLQRHRLVYKTVGKPADIGLHALAVRALAPDEAGGGMNSIPDTHLKGETSS